MEGMTALDVHVSTMQDRFRDACRTGDLDVIKYILKELPEEDMLQLIHQSGYPGYEGHRPFMTGSPMFEAVLASQPAVVDYLASIGYDLEHECDIHVSYPVVLLDKCTALCVACACGAVEIARILLLRGANVNHTSHHSSPVIYASECRDVTLASLLLEHGADIQTVPRGLKSYAAILPLYQACLNGHKETAELFLRQSRDCISPLKRICFLALLGAQCINRNADFNAGITFWSQALNELHSGFDGAHQNDTDDLIRVFQEFHIDCLATGKPTPIRIPPTSRGVDLSDGSSVMRHSAIFDGVRLCKTVEELNSLADDHPALVLQALLVLQAILGPSHTETLQQVCQAARSAQEDGDLSRACWLYLYIIECSELYDQTNDATDYSSQLAEMLLNIHCGNDGSSLDSIKNASDFLVSAIDLACSGIVKMHVALFPQPFPSNMAKIDAVEMKLHSKVRLFTEMVETLMAFLRLFIAIELRGTTQWDRVHKVVTDLLLKCRALTPEFSKFSVESEMMKIAVHGDHSAMSTLYFFQEDLFPDANVVKFLLGCDASVNCRDFQGDTPLHHAVDCSRPCAAVVLFLINNGAHIDTCNRQGMTPASLLQRQTPAGSLHNVVNLFDLVSLRCLAARAVIDSGIEFRGGVVPTLVENFVKLHVAPDILRPGGASSSLM